MARPGFGHAATSPGSGAVPIRARQFPRVMKAGSALLYLGGLTHSGGANRSTADRTGVVIGYCAGWLRTYEEQFLAYPREVARDFPEELQRLIGYQQHRPNLGGWEGQDPIEYLRDAAARAARTGMLCRPPSPRS